MDSGNSGSLQSSSGGGGDDDFDTSSSSPLSALLLRQHHPPPSPSPFAGSPIYGLHNLATPPVSHCWPSTATTATPSLPAGGGAEASTLPRGQQAPAAASAADDDRSTAPPPGQAQAQAHPAPPPRGPRKRARASRRAPTTVLTTDASNFRAMVQEFTGVPAPPFAAAAAAAAARSRFDHLFPSRASAAAAPPPYLLRPIASKHLHASSPAPDSTAADAYRLASPPPPALRGMLPQGHHSSSSGYLSFQSALAAQVDAKYPAAPPTVLGFDHGLLAAPSAARLQDPNGLLGLTAAHGAVGAVGEAATHSHLHPRNCGDELSGLVGAASAVSATGAGGGCKNAVYSSVARSNGQSPSPGVSTAATTPAVAAAAMRTQGADSWICTSSSE